MGIYVQGAARCAICGEVFAGYGDAVGFPQVTLSPINASMSGNSAHRACLRRFPGEPELRAVMSRYWRGSAERGGRAFSVVDECYVYGINSDIQLASVRHFVAIRVAASDGMALVHFLERALSSDQDATFSGCSMRVAHQVSGVRMRVRTLPAERSINTAMSELIDLRLPHDEWQALCAALNGALRAYLLHAEACSEDAS